MSSPQVWPQRQAERPVRLSELIDQLVEADSSGNALPTLEQAKALLLTAALRRTNWDIGQAAKKLDISLSTAYSWMKCYAITGGQ